MLLTVRERLILLSILPQEGDFLTLKVLRKLQENLGFSEDEFARYKFENLADGRVKWDNAEEQDKEVELGRKATEIIVTALTKLNDQKKLKLEHYDLYGRFVEPEEDKDA